MGTSIREHSVGGLRWLVVTGPRLDGFRALGEHARGEIRDVVEGMPERPALERFVATERGRAALDRVVAATAVAHPVEYAELEALAAGAGVGFDTMMLANVRGDLGGDEGTGCSDLGWRRTRSVMAHNEDGAPALQGRFMLVTLAVEGEAPVTAEWYAGFLPSNTFAVNGHGLAWGINHLQVSAPAAAAGRHFVARGLQRAHSLEAAIDFLATHPSAGGFAYNLGEVATGRVATVESAAGRVAVVEADPATQPMLWHTNHMRYLDDDQVALADGVPSVVDEAARSLGLPDESRARGCVIEAIGQPLDEPSPDWFLDVLTTPAPRGVYRSATDGDPLMTLCSAAVDLTGAEVTLQPRGVARVRLPLGDLAAGRASALNVST
jgi:Acyl-coenzyme A:6-aminopenicillanic acid acyl-transferase